MEHNRWQQIEELYHAALEREPESRAAFLDEACAGDEKLRREVASLLTYDDQPASFIEAPVLEVAARELVSLSGAQTQPIAPARIGAYQILSLLGRGGMGDVHLALDTRLGRKVAVKLLPAEFTHDRERVRRFFREAYQQDKALRELTEEVRQFDSLTEMARHVSQKVDAALHPERLYLFYREEGRRDLALVYSSAYSSGGLSRDLRIPAEFELLRFMEYQGGAQDFPFPAKTRLPPQEKKWLASLGASLIVPMSGTDGQLKGLLVLGPKKSEIPYTGSDRQLLETLADQIALVYENAQLKKRLAKDRRV
jgi:hypothetical protein